MFRPTMPVYTLLPNVVAFLLEGCEIDYYIEYFDLALLSFGVTATFFALIAKRWVKE